MIKTLSEFTHKNVNIYQMFDSGALWYTVELDDEEHNFDSLDSAKNFINERKERRMKGLVFNPEKGEFSIIETTEGNSLKTWYNTIDCRCIDICRRKVGGKEFEIVIDDEGLLVENPILAAINPFGQPMLCGTLIFYGGVDREGNLTEITPDDVKIIKRNVAHAVMRDGTERDLIMMDY